MTATIPGVLLPPGDHASRPAATGVEAGTLYSCTDHSLIYQSDGSTWSTWATLGGGGDVATDAIWDAAGDLAVGSGANTAAKLTAGSEDDVLTIVSGVPAWAAAGGGSSRPYLDTASALDGTYGDDFDGASLNARWNTLNNLTNPTDFSFQEGGATYLGITLNTSTGPRGIFQSWTPSATAQVIASFIYVTNMENSASMIGPQVLDSSNNGVAAFLYSGSLYVGDVSGYVLGGSSTAGIQVPSTWHQNGTKIWLRLRRATNDWYASASLNGYIWTPEATRSKTITPNKIGFGRGYVTGSGTQLVYLDRFNVV